MGQPQQTSQQPSYINGDYPPGYDPSGFVAPPRTEYDYSPLDLAPSGQRRRRQLVAAAIGGLSVLLLGAIIFFSYLLLRDEKPPTENDDLLASQTEVAQKQATLAAEQTVVAQVAVDQTQQAESQQGTAEGEGNETPAGDSETEPTATTAAEQTEETPADGAEPTATTAAGPGAENSSLTPEQLNELLPAAEIMPEGLTETSDANLDLAFVTEAIGGNRIAETNLEEWGWSGNAQRQFTPAEGTEVDPASTSSIVVSIHGFATPEGAGEALVYFSDIIINSDGYVEGDDPGLGDSSRIVSLTAEDGSTNVALYVQQGSVMYRFGGFSASGDPTADVIAVAEEVLAS